MSHPRQHLGLPQPLERDGGHPPAQPFLRMRRAIEAIALPDRVAHEAI